MAQRRTSLYLQGSTFFGLGSDYKKALFKQIHEIVFHGQGGYDWNTVYNMPVWLREYTFSEIKQYYEKQQEEVNKIQNKNKSTKPKVLKPNIKPSYKTKASKQKPFLFI